MSQPSGGGIEERYRDTVEYLCSFERFGILLGLENIAGLLEKLGNPQWAFPTVHIAGSNGKGSTASFIYGAMMEAGYKTALYTSPHLNDFRERIRLNGSLVSREAIIEAVERIRPLHDPDRTTFFEYTTAVAFECMAQARPDLAVIEVGLGGRLDATNMVQPLVTVITDISREHEDYLGVGIESVAREKAGIIKERVPLVTGASRSAARAVILDRAKALDAPVRQFGKDFWGMRTGPFTFTYSSRDLVLENLRLTMPGSHQMKNASLALAVLEELNSRGYAIDEKAIRRGIETTRFPGRFEVLRRKPDVVIDGAHTPEGMRLLKSTLNRLYPGIKPLLLLGMLRDKNYEQLVRIIAPVAKEVVCVAPQGNRALDPDELAGLVLSLGVPARSATSIEEGFRLLEAKASRDDLILAAGSLYMIGPVRTAYGAPDD